MKTRLSRLVDGELEQHEQQILFDALRRGEDLRGNWRDYMLVGAALRREDPLSRDITGRVMSAIEHEPIAFAPRNMRQHAWHRPVLAMAATLAGVGVVGWMALMQPGSPAPVSVATTAPQGATAAQREAPAMAVRHTTRDMREYLAAHQAQSGFLQFRGGTEYIRTVSATGKAPAK